MVRVFTLPIIRLQHLLSQLNIIITITITIALKISILLLLLQLLPNILLLP